MLTVAGIVLVGGRSSRMGEPKAALDWHGSTLLRHTASLLARTLNGPIVVVGGPGQDLPAIPPGVELHSDPVEGHGPVQGIAVGLAAVVDRAQVAFVCSVDMPFLHPVFIRRVLGGLADSDAEIALPFVRGYRQPLAAAYRTSLAAPIATWLDQGIRRPGQVFERCRVRTLHAEWLLADPDLARLDPGLDSVTNVNDPDDYAEALRRPWAGPGDFRLCFDERVTDEGDLTRVCSASREVAAASEVIFELIADPEQQPRWDGNANLAASEAGQRVRGAGTVFTMTLTTGAVRENHIVEFEEARRIAWTPSEPGSTPPGHLWRWELQRLDAARTLVTHTYDWSGLDPADEMRQAKARAMTSAKLEGSLDRLAALAESA